MVTNPYSAPSNEVSTVGSSRFRFGLIPATLLFFIAFLTATYGAMVVPNILRDASNGYDLRYLLSMSTFPASLFGIASCCIFAGRYIVIGKIRNAFLVTFPALVCVLVLWRVVSLLLR